MLDFSYQMGLRWAGAALLSGWMSKRLWEICALLFLLMSSQSFCFSQALKMAPGCVLNNASHVAALEVEIETINKFPFSKVLLW